MKEVNNGREEKNYSPTGLLLRNLLQGGFNCYRRRAGTDTTAERYQGEGRYLGWGQAGFDVLGKGREGVLLYADQSGSTGGNGEGCAGTAGEGNILGLFR